MTGTQSDGLKQSSGIASSSWKMTAAVRSAARMISPRLQASQGLIGWLQQTRGRLGTMDVTSEFEKNLANVVDGDDTLPSEYDYLFVPGYLWRW